MKETKKNHTYTICVCGGGKCKDRGSKEVQKKFKKVVEKEGLSDSIAVKKSDCLGKCSQAPVVRVKPEKELHTGVSKKDVQTMIQDLSHRKH